MRFELDPHLPPARAVRSVALAQLDYALAELARGDKQGVHETRKVCKKLRALLRLIRPFLGDSYAIENRRLRDAARSLSGRREAAVLVQTARRLSGIAGLAARLCKLGRRAHATQASPLAGAERLLQAQRTRVAEWRLRRLSAGGLLVGLLAGYRAARRQYRDARRKRTGPALHEWRKRAKYHGYQCSLMARLWPVARQRVPRLKQLSDLLGDHHDVFVLSQTLQRHPSEFGGARRTGALRRQLAAGQRQRVQQAIVLGEQLFRDAPMDWFTEAASS